MKEIWKPISTKIYYWENAINSDYEVSNLGNIRNKKTGKLINPFFTQNGNKLRWTMHKKMPSGWYSTLQFLVDQTVYVTFNDTNESYGKSIKHKDGNNFNNALDNLYI